MKNNTILAALLALAPLSAAAQVTSILPGGQGNLLIGTPVSLPGPMTNPVIGSRITLPAPLLTPALSLNAPAPLLAAAVISMPARPANLPTIIPSMPKAILPSSTPALAIARLSAAATPDKPSDKAAEKAEKLDETFDGRKVAEKDAVVVPGRRLPTMPGRHISLPEQDLESEIGAY